MVRDPLNYPAVDQWPERFHNIRRQTESVIAVFCDASLWMDASLLHKARVPQLHAKRCIHNPDGDSDLVLRSLDETFGLRISFPNIAVQPEPPSYRITGTHSYCHSDQT